MAELIRTQGSDETIFPSASPERVQSRRSILQIRMEILKVVMNGSGKPTQIMYKANLSWTVLQSQLKVFVQSGLLRAIEYGNRKKYVITERGVEMIKSYDHVIDQVLRD